MHIGLYTAFLTPGQIGGIETYLRQLIHHLARVDRRNRYTLFVTAENRHLFANLPDNFQLAQISLLPPGPFVVARLLYKLGLLPVYAARQMERYPLDVLHYPGSTIDQPAIKIPCLLTLHDIQHEYHPDFFDSITLKTRQQTFPVATVIARHIITISEFTRQTVIETYKVSPKKITAVHHGISPNFKPAGDEGLVAAIRQKYRLPEQFIFYPANSWPHKNHARLFEAIKLLREQYGFNVHLVLSGIWSDAERLRQQIHQFEVADQIHLLEYLPYEDLPALYNAAAALVFPSLFEGFGLPVLEAMACGCPVICSNTTSLPELAGEAALFVDPTDVVQTAESIYTLLQDCSLQKSLRAKGFVQAKKFSWERAARETVDIYESVW